MSVTDSFLELDDTIRECQNVETFNDCETGFQGQLYTPEETAELSTNQKRDKLHTNTLPGPVCQLYIINGSLYLGHQAMYTKSSPLKLKLEGVYRLCTNMFTDYTELKLASPVHI